MKRTLTRIMAAVLAVMLMLTAAACDTPAAKLEQKLGVSFENIVCQYSHGPGWIQDPLEDFATNITVYADGRVRIWTDHNDVVLAEAFTTISQEKIDALIKSIRKNNLFALDDCSDYDILDGGWSNFYFFDAEGNKVHDCGGLNCTNDRYCDTKNLFVEYFPYNDPLIDSVENQSYGALEVYLLSIGAGYKLQYSDLRGTVLNIRCFNEEFKGFFERYYTMPEGIIVNWIIDPADDGIYYNRLDEALAAQNAGELRGDDAIDMVIVDAEYLEKYIESNYILPLKQLRYQLPDTSYPYAIEASTNSKGEQMAVPIYLYPGALIYRRSIARDVLGTDDPAQVQEMLDSWEKFEQVAADAKAKGYYMTASFADTLRPFAGKPDAFGTTCGNNPQRDNCTGEWLTQAETFLQNEYTLPHTLWSDDKQAQMAADGKTMCFFGPAWYYRYCMYPIQEDSYYDDWASSYGDWAICQGPQSFEWGSTWLLPCKGTDNAALLWDIFDTFTSDTEVCQKLIRNEYVFPNNTEAVLNEINDEYYSNSLLGGQNDLAVQHEIALQMSWNGLNEYRDFTIEYMPEYILPALLGKQSYDYAMEEYIGQLSSVLPEPDSE